MSYYYCRTSRRGFLRGLGGLIAAPLFPSLLSAEARAASSANRRLIAITTPNQLPAPLIFPDGYFGKTAPADLSTFVQKRNDGLYPFRSLDLNQVISARGSISRLLDAKFNPYASKLSLYRGLDMPGRVDHGRSTILGNVAGSVMGAAQQLPPMKTMDEFLAASPLFYPAGRQSVKYPILRLGESSISTENHTSPRANSIGGANGALTLNGNLKQIFDEMFSVYSQGSAKASVVDRVLASANAIKSGSAIGRDDRLNLESYMDSLNDLQKSLRSPPTVTGSKPALALLDQNAAGMGTLAAAASLTPRYYDDLAKLAVLAIKCGGTKIVTVGVSTALIGNVASTQDGTVRTWHLNYAHGNDNAGLLALNKFVMDRVFFEILKNLDTVEANGETYLDNTLMIFSPEMAFGHSGINYAGVLAGNRKGGLVHGNLYEYQNFDQRLEAVGKYYNLNLEIGPGQPINRLWLGMLKSLGLTPADYLNKFGNGSSTFGYWRFPYANAYESYFFDVVRDQKIGEALAGIFA